MATKPGVIIKKFKCYGGAVEEFADDLYAKLIDPATEEFKNVDLQFAVDAINVGIKNVKETLFECEGIEINIAPKIDGIGGVLFDAVVQIFGIILNPEIDPELPGALPPKQIV